MLAPSAAESGCPSGIPDTGKVTAFIEFVQQECNASAATQHKEQRALNSPLNIENRALTVTLVLLFYTDGQWQQKLSQRMFIYLYRREFMFTSRCTRSFSTLLPLHGLP